MGRLSSGIIRIMLVVALWSPQCWGYETPPDPMTKDRVDELMGRYNLYPAFTKLGRGLANFFFGFTEIPLNIQKWYSRSDTGGSFLTGTAHGVFRGFVRTGVGLYETITFFLPYPEHFAPILPTLPYFQRQSRRVPLPLE